MRTKLISLTLIAASSALAVYLYNGYGTLEPCGMMRAEVQIRLMDGRIETLGDTPKLIVNNGDQIWCAKAFVIAHLP